MIKYASSAVKVPCKVLLVNIGVLLLRLGGGVVRHRKVQQRIGEEAADPKELKRWIGLRGEVAIEETVVLSKNAAAGEG
jgi:hypothetical protein